MRYKNFWIRFIDLLLILGLLAGYQGVIYYRDTRAEIADLKSQVNQLEGEKEEIIEVVQASGRLSGSGDSDANAAVSYKDGTYTGSGEGFGGTVKVSVTVSGQKITDIQITEAKGEDEAYLGIAKDIIQTMLEKQTAEVDTISGATYSSTGIKNAVTEALKGAVKS